jgi:hypothetical protein
MVSFIVAGDCRDRAQRSVKTGATKFRENRRKAQ